VTVCRRRENGEMGRGEIRLSGVCGTEERGRKEKEKKGRGREHAWRLERRGKEKKEGEEE
jgi:hypothetical protein